MKWVLCFLLMTQTELRGGVVLWEIRATFLKVMSVFACSTCMFGLELECVGMIFTFSKSEQDSRCLDALRGTCIL
ncbi:hypothetical protein BaRGS_00001119, partial [Batillaria attramentaria]